VHGGHSGAYCGHASDSLAEIVQRYIELGFEWICLTEHMPLVRDDLMPVEDVRAGLTAAALERRFASYFAEARRLRTLHAEAIEIFVGFETEVFDGYQPVVSALIEAHQPDVLVGSVHHVHNVMIDAGEADYAKAVRLSGGIEELYCDYFDVQLELIETFRPAIVGHFDLIRLHDADYKTRWQVPAIRNRALRNLTRIRELDLLLDLNLRAMSKGDDEPYLSRPFLQFAIEHGIAIAPGDDSHGVSGVGANWSRGMSAIAELGGELRWRKPVI